MRAVYNVSTLNNNFKYGLMLPFHVPISVSRAWAEESHVPECELVVRICNPKHFHWCKAHGQLSPASAASCGLIPNANQLVVPDTGVISQLNEMARVLEPADPARHGLKDQIIGGIPVAQMTNEQYARMSGTIVEESTSVAQPAGATVNALLSRSVDGAPRVLPKEYSVYEDGMITDWEVLDQKQCGSCWAFSTTDVFSYMVAKAKAMTQGAPQPAILHSITQMFMCSSGNDVVANGRSVLGEAIVFPGSSTASFPRSYRSGTIKPNLGCDGGYITRAIDWLIANTGAILSSKQSEENRMANMTNFALSLRANPQQCVAANIPVGPVPALSGTVISGEMEIKKHLLTHGPVIGAMQTESRTDPRINAACSTYQGGIFTMTEGKYDHAIVVVGWGEIDGAKYWIIKNSWGPKWGYNANQTHRLYNYPNTRGFMKLAINALDLRFAYGMCVGQPQNTYSQASEVARAQYAEGQCLPRQSLKTSVTKRCCIPGVRGICPQSTMCHPLYHRCVPTTSFTVTPSAYQDLCGLTETGRCPGQHDGYVCARCQVFQRSLQGVPPPKVCQLFLE